MVIGPVMFLRRAPTIDHTKTEYNCDSSFEILLIYHHNIYVLLSNLEQSLHAAFANPTTLGHRLSFPLTQYFIVSFNLLFS